MTRVESSVIVDGPIEKVWAVLSDLGRQKEWDPGTVEVEWQKPISLGSTFRVTTELGRIFGRRTARCTLVRYEQNREIGWEARQSGIGLKVVYSIEPFEAAKTKLSRLLELKIGARWKILSPVISRSAKRGREAEIGNIKRIVEQEHQGLT